MRKKEKGKEREDGVVGPGVETDEDLAVVIGGGGEAQVVIEGEV